MPNRSGAQRGVSSGIACHATTAEQRLQDIREGTKQTYLARGQRELALRQGQTWNTSAEEEGKAVAAVEALLKKATGGNVTVDGKISAQEEQILTAYQEKKFGSADGKIGQNTLAALEQDAGMTAIQALGAGSAPEQAGQQVAQSADAAPPNPAAIAAAEQSAAAHPQSASMTATHDNATTTADSAAQDAAKSAADSAYQIKGQLIDSMSSSVEEMNSLKAQIQQLRAGPRLPKELKTDASKNALRTIQTHFKAIKSDVNGPLREQHTALRQDPTLEQAQSLVNILRSTTKDAKVANNMMASYLGARNTAIENYKQAANMPDPQTRNKRIAEIAGDLDRFSQQFVSMYSS